MHLTLPCLTLHLVSLHFHIRLISSHQTCSINNTKQEYCFSAVQHGTRVVCAVPTYTRLPITVGGLTRKRVFNPNSSATHCEKSPTMADNSNGANESPAVAHDPPTDTSANKRKRENSEPNTETPSRAMSLSQTQNDIYEIIQKYADIKSMRNGSRLTSC
jgi:hypothetical protein